jgi:hypothetical protein
MNIVEVRSLPNGMTNPYIKLSIETPQVSTYMAQDIGQTPAQSNENPVYNARF